MSIIPRSLSLNFLRSWLAIVLGILGPREPYLADLEARELPAVGHYTHINEAPGRGNDVRTDFLHLRGRFEFPW